MPDVATSTPRPDSLTASHPTQRARNAMYVKFVIGEALSLVFRDAIHRANSAKNVELDTRLRHHCRQSALPQQSPEQRHVSTWRWPDISCSFVVAALLCAVEAALGMGIFDRLRGKDSSAPSSSGAELPSEALSSAQPSQQSAPELLDLPSLGSSGDQDAPGSTGRFYNPYEGLNTAVDGRSLKAAYRLPQQPEFLFSEEAPVHRRSWSENLTYYTGTGYVTGAAPPEPQEVLI